jgi:predicted ribonuclease YlaK
LANLKIRYDDLITLDALSDKQGEAIQRWKSNDNLILSGSAGTGKTYLALHLALSQVLDKSTQYDKVIIVRSIVPTRDIGFLPGTEEEKQAVYTLPYKSLCAEMFAEVHDAWEVLSHTAKIEFISTSFVRGQTFNNAIVVIDESQNCNFHELDSVITRIGKNCRFIMCGDYYQSDLHKKSEREGIKNFIDILETLKGFRVIEFTWADIVRSDIVRDYICSKEQLGY